MRRGLTWALSSVALIIIMVVAAAPGVASAAPERGGEAPISLPEGLRVGGMEVLSVDQAPEVTTLTLAPEGNRRTAQVVTCTIFHTTPSSSNGVTVQFTVDVRCDAMVDQLIIEVGMVMFLTGSGYFAVPGSYRKCELLATDQLDCTSSSSCFFAEFYYGVSYLQAYLDQSYATASLQTASQAIACAV